MTRKYSPTTSRNSKLRNFQCFVPFLLYFFASHTISCGFFLHASLRSNQRRTRVWVPRIQRTGTRDHGCGNRLWDLPPRREAHQRRHTLTVLRPRLNSCLTTPLPHRSSWELHRSFAQSPHLGIIFDSSSSHAPVRMEPTPTAAVIRPGSLGPPPAPRFCPYRLRPTLKPPQRGPSKIKSQWYSSAQNLHRFFITSRIKLRKSPSRSVRPYATCKE